MYYINKLVGVLINPLVLAGVIASAGMFFALKRRRRSGYCIAAGAAALLWFWSTPLMTVIVGAPLESEFLKDGRVPEVESFSAVDAIVVLGGSMGVNAELSPYAEMSASADRVWQAARLWKAGKAPVIIATGDKSRESTLGLLKDMGVDAERVKFLDARNTEEEARVVGRLVSGGGTGRRRILLVTSAWHMKRARMMFEKYAPELQVFCAPADFEMMALIENSSWWRRFGADAYTLHLNSVAFHEWVGMLGYRIFR